MSEEQPSLGQLIWLVRRELEWAYAVDAKNPLRFEVGPVELDVTVEATNTTKGGGGLDLKVMGVGASGDLSREGARGTTTRVHVVLTPRDTRRAGGKYVISAVDTEPPPRRAEVTGEPLMSSGPGSEGGLGARDTEPPPGN
jgi:Trypsin-co-occurring domain 2